MSAVEVVAAIVSIFFAVGIVVGFLLVMAIPAFGRTSSGGSQQLQHFHPDPKDQPGIGPPGPAPCEEPDDRDDNPWWPSQR